MIKVLALILSQVIVLVGPAKSATVNESGRAVFHDRAFHGLNEFFGSNPEAVVSAPLFKKDIFVKNSSINMDMLTRRNQLVQVSEGEFHWEFCIDDQWFGSRYRASAALTYRGPRQFMELAERRTVRAYRNSPVTADVLSRCLPSVFEVKLDSQSVSNGAKQNTFLDVYGDVSSGLSLANFSGDRYSIVSGPDSLMRLAQGGFDPRETHGGYRHSSNRSASHHESPYHHPLLSIQVLMGAMIFLFGLYYVDRAFRKGNTLKAITSGFYAFIGAYSIFAGIVFVGYGLWALTT